MNESYVNKPHHASAPSWLDRAELVLVQARRVRVLLEGRLGGFGLSEPELALLWACVTAPPGGRSQCELADELAVSPAHVCALVERLARAGLLQGRAAPGDRRRRLWEPTSVGRALWHSIDEELDDLQQSRGAA